MDKTTHSASKRVKRSLADALKKLMSQKSLDKITIHELTESCGMRRQSFYYHFEDIYDLLRWMFEDEAVVLLQQHEGEQLWQEGLLQLFQYLQDNKAVCLCALKSVGRIHVKRFFEGEVYAIIHNTVEQVAASISVSANTADVNIEMATDFYVFALTGILESWLLGEISNTPEELISFLDTILQDHIRGAYARINKESADSMP